MTIRETCQGWVEDIFGTGLFDDVKGILTLNPSTGDYSSVWKVISNIYEDVCVPIGMGLVLIYFIANLYERALQQNFDLEHMVKTMLKLFVGLYFIEHGLELMASIYSLGFSFLNTIVDSAGDTYTTENLVKKAWKALSGENWEGEWGKLEGAWKFMGLVFELGIPYIVTKVMKIVVNFVCYTRLIEFYIRTAAAPIALSDFFTEGLHGNGWKFIKGYIAIALQAGIIMLAVVVFNAIAASLVGSNPNLEDEGYWDFMIKYLALGFATIGLMLKSLSLTKEIVGSN